MNKTNMWEIDPTNPGEVLACAGLAHLAWRKDRQATTGFELRKGIWYFAIKPDDLDILAPLRIGQSCDITQTEYGLQWAGIDLDWWQPWGVSPDLKLWAGQQNEETVHKNLIAATRNANPTDWLTGQAPTGGRLSVDVIGLWNAIGLGWSINEQKKHQMLCRPWLELLASIGLQVFPMNRDKSDRSFRYHLWHPAPLAPAIAAFAGFGLGLNAVAMFRVQTEKNGSNSILKRAEPLLLT